MRAAWKRRGDAIHAVDAQDLLVQVNLANEIGAEGRSDDLDLLVTRFAFDIAAQIGEDAELFLVADIGADVRT